LPRLVRGWLREACGRTVEHMPMPHPGIRVDTTVVPQGVEHTIEGSLESGLSVFRRHYSPTFTVGGTRIIQHIPLGFMAAALEHTRNPPTNGWARVQIETAGRSSEHYWLPEPKTLDSLARLMAALSFNDVAGIPLSRPFADPMPAPPWSTPLFSRRLSGHWGRTAGWYGHVDVPENSHWDPGALLWGEVLRRAKEYSRGHALTQPKPKLHPRPKQIPAAVWQRFRPRTGQHAVSV
jgi:hypothetical protein